MPIARKHLISADQPGCYHLISRCVRRAFLCGDRAEHRRAWVTERIQAVAAFFAVDSESWTCTLFTYVYACKSFYSNYLRRS